MPSFCSPATIASIEPWTSDLITTGSSLASPLASWLNISSTELRGVVAAGLRAPLALPVLGDLARAALVVDHDQRVAGVGHAVEAEDLDRHRRARPPRRCWPRSSTSARTRPHWPPQTMISPTLSVPRWISTVATTPRPRSSLASITVPWAGRSGLARSSRISACSWMASISLSRLVRLQGADLDAQHVAAELLGHQLVAEQLLLDPVGIGVGPVDLVDRDHDRHPGRAGVRDRLDRLRHDAVVGGDHQDDDVGDLGAARPHLGERRVARRVDERHRLAGAEVDLVGADVLGDAAGLVRRDVGMAQRVQQRGLAVVDVAHDGHHRRPRPQILGPVLDALEADLDVGLADPLGLMAELGDQQLRGVGVERLVDGRHDAHLHQLLDDIGAAHRHAVGELGHGDRLGQHHLAHERAGSSSCCWRFSRSRWRAQRGERRARAARPPRVSLSSTSRPRAGSRRIAARRGFALVGAVLALALGLAACP